MTTTAGALAIEKRYDSGILRWITTVNHKDIGILYMVTAFAFFCVGGLESLLMRTQLGSANNTFLPPDVYNQIFTMHGTTMIFLFVMPMMAGFANYTIPLMIGARDMAFPRLNALSYWFLLFGGLMLYSSFLLGGAPADGWFAYAPLTTGQYSASHGMDFWVLGILMTGVGSTLGVINFIVTILNMRAPGMSFARMPLFVWQLLVTSFLILFALPSLTVAAILLFFERNFGAPFYAAAAGGDPLLWQHLFWFFGHPEVYILILPAFGIISEVLPVFSRKPIFGYTAVAYSGVAIGFLGFTVWAHHMFAVGMSPIADAIFSLDSMIIAVPTSIKIFNWIATIWGGKINLKAPFLFAVGFIAMFIIGGLSGVSLAVVPIDFQVTDTYYVVAHLHYVLFGGSVFAIFSGIFYWFPKITGRLMSDRIGKLQFWAMFVGFNLTFFPMHILGLLGMPRRIYTYGNNLGWDTWNLLETVGAFIIGLSILVFLWNFFVSIRRGEKAGNDPWDAQTLEWTTTSPPPEYNFAAIPTVNSRRPFWDLKYPALAHGKTPGMTVPEAHGPIHMPAGSFNPIIIGLGLTIAFYGLLYNYPLAVAGVAVIFAGIIRWAREPR
ncbi:MAG: cytochrome c oxidase subunit I [Chloroflexota bacterium]|nr:cytochrome c oxidase subunit I [Chloroflexota bacterium]